MDKKDILSKSRKDNSYLDEMQQSELRNGFGFGGVVMAILCVVFSIIKALQGQRFFEFVVILFAYMSATALYSYLKTRKKQFLIQTIAEGITGVLGFIGYFFITG
jgi:uncharacterized membrane protein YjjP (DUF1212 family)